MLPKNLLSRNYMESTLGITPCCLYTSLDLPLTADCKVQTVNSHIIVTYLLGGQALNVCMYKTVITTYFNPTMYAYSIYL